jgi:hypothetical protein
VEPAIAYLKGQQPPGAFWSFTSDSAGFLTSHVIQSASEPAALR